MTFPSIKPLLKKLMAKHQAEENGGESQHDRNR
jgi:hypothetical protein